MFQVFRIAILTIAICWPTLSFAQDLGVGDLTLLLKSSDAGLACTAARKLRNYGIGDPAAIQALVEVLSDNRQVPTQSALTLDRVCSTAADSLISIGAPALAAVMEFYDRSDSTEDQRRAINIIGRIGAESDAAWQRVRAALNADDPQLRIVAIRAAQQLKSGTQELITALIPTLGDSKPYVQDTAASALALQGSISAPAIHDLIWLSESRETTARMCGCFISTMIPVRMEAVHALGNIGPSASVALPRLTEMAFNDLDKNVRLAAAVAIWKIAKTPRPGVDILSNEFQPPDFAGIDACDELGSHALPLLPKLIELLNGDNENIRSEVIRVTAKVAPDRAAALILPWVMRIPVAVEQNGDYDDSEFDTREAAITALGELGGRDPQVVAVLLNAATFADGDTVAWHEQLQIRRAALQVLGRFGDPAKETLPALEAMSASLDDELLKPDLLEAIDKIKAAANSEQ